MDAALIATGRSPFTKGLGLEKVNYALNFEAYRFSGGCIGIAKNLCRHYQH